jgi:acyl-CoA thioesterase-1
MRTLVLLAALSALAAPSIGWSATDTASDRREPLTIVAFGDSLTSGNRLPRREAYPAQLEAALRADGVAANVINRGVSGETSAGGVRRLDAVLAEQPQMLIVAFGANDGLRGVPVAQLRANLETIIGTAQARGIAVLLCGMEALPLYGWQYTVDFHNLFPAVAAKYHVPLVPFLLNGVLGNPDLMSADGVHPNASGAHAIAETIRPYVERMAQTLPATKDTK